MTVLRLVDGPESPSAPLDIYGAALIIATTLEEVGARMVPIDSPERALALRSAERWATIAGCRPVRLDPRHGLEDARKLTELREAALMAAACLSSATPWKEASAEIAENISNTLARRRGS